MSVKDLQMLLAVLAWNSIAWMPFVDLVPLRNEETTIGEQSRPPRNLGDNEITKLLDDLDNQTEAIQNGQEIGVELLSGTNKITPKQQKTDTRNNSSTGRESTQSSMSGAEKVTDDESQAVSIPEAPVLADANGIPEKTTVIESGASYLTGKPLLVINRENKNPDVNKWFLYYPLSTESDTQIP